MKRKVIISAVILVIAYISYPFLMIGYTAEKVEEVINTSATDLSSCELIEYGYSGCGGPTSYLIYSTETTNKEQLAKLVDKQYRLEKRIHMTLMLISTCGLPIKPVLELENNICIGVSPFSHLLTPEQ